MTKSAAVVEFAARLAADGKSQAAIARQLSVSRAALREWSSLGYEVVAARRRAAGVGDACTPEACPARANAITPTYAYLLGLYLGDGCLSRGPRNVWRLRVFCCDAYPALMSECRHAMSRVMPASKVGSAQMTGCTEVHSDSKHWICVFPQHGPGRKHERPIELAEWQQAIADRYPEALIRGLIHSDGCRVTNRVKVRGVSYEYPRYFFSNVSDDIRSIFCDACDAVGVEWRQNRWNSISVARRESVALLDTFVGPKR